MQAAVSAWQVALLPLPRQHAFVAVAHCMLSHSTLPGSQADPPAGPTQGPASCVSVRGALLPAEALAVVLVPTPDDGPVPVVPVVALDLLPLEAALVAVLPCFVLPASSPAGEPLLLEQWTSSMPAANAKGDTQASLVRVIGRTSSADRSRLDRSRHRQTCCVLDA